MEDWTEKYRPKQLEGIIGNEKAITSLRVWAEQWKKGVPPKKRAVILSGKPGIGKTSSALALADDFGWTPLELNASDARNATMIRRVATSGALNETFDATGRFLSSSSGGRKLIILDEADNLYERVESSPAGNDFSDKGGKKAIIETIKMTSQPIILIVNDYYSLTKGGGESLRQICTLIPFYEVSASQIVDLLKRLCLEEGVSADLKLLQTIADRCKGDVRSAVNDLQSICINRQQVDVEGLDALGYRDRDKIIFDALRDVFKTRNIQNLRETSFNVDIPPEMFLLWLTENLPREYLDIEDLIRGYEALSKADVFFGRVYRRQGYGLWSYACDLMQGGLSVAKTHNYGNMKYFSPSWIKEMRDTKPERVVRDSVMRKIGGLCHNSGLKSREFLLPHFQFLFQNNLRFAGTMRMKLDLSEPEIKYLLGKRYLHKMKEILQFSEKYDEKQVEIEVVPVDIVEKEEKKEIEQPSLFDF